MPKINKSILGLFGIAAAFAAIVGCLSAPIDASAFGATRTDTLNVRVISQYPTVNLLSIKRKPGDDSTVIVYFDYEHAQNIIFALSFTSTNGDIETIPVIEYAVDESAEQYGVGSIEISLAGYGDKYNDFNLTASSHSKIGFAEDSITLAAQSIDSRVLSSLDSAADASKAHSEENTSNSRLADEDILISSALLITLAVISSLILVNKIEKHEHTAVEGAETDDPIGYRVGRFGAISFTA